MKRRNFLAFAAASPALSAAPAMNLGKIPTRKVGKVETVFKSPGPQPNGLQATKEGLWIMDQGAENKAYLVSYEDGKVLRSFAHELGVVESAWENAPAVGGRPGVGPRLTSVAGLTTRWGRFAADHKSQAATVDDVGGAGVATPFVVFVRADQQVVVAIAVHVPRARDAVAGIVECLFAHELGIGQRQVEGSRDWAQHQVGGTRVGIAFFVAVRSD